MGVDIYYCGECHETAHSDCFPQCHNEDCCEPFESSSGHGRICEDCIEAAVKNKEVFKSKKCKDGYFCSKNCRKEWIEEFKKNEKDIRKCEVCNKEGDMNTLFESDDCEKPKHVYCSIDCKKNSIRKCHYCDKEQKRSKMEWCNGRIYCDSQCRKNRDKENN